MKKRGKNLPESLSELESSRRLQGLEGGLGLGLPGLVPSVLGPPGLVPPGLGPPRPGLIPPGLVFLEPGFELLALLENPRNIFYFLFFPGNEISRIFVFRKIL